MKVAAGKLKLSMRELESKSLHPRHAAGVELEPCGQKPMILLPSSRPARPPVACQGRDRAPAHADRR
jgi:hypothetical protein